MKRNQLTKPEISEINLVMGERKLLKKDLGLLIAQKQTNDIRARIELITEEIDEITEYVKEIQTGNYNDYLDINGSDSKRYK